MEHKNICSAGVHERADKGFGPLNKDLWRVLIYGLVVFGTLAIFGIGVSAEGLYCSQGYTCPIGASWDSDASGCTTGFVDVKEPINYRTCNNLGVCTNGTIYATYRRCPSNYTEVTVARCVHRCSPGYWYYGRWVGGICARVCTSDKVCRWTGTSVPCTPQPLSCSDLTFVSRVSTVPNYATTEGCGANAIANVLYYHMLLPNTPAGVRSEFSRYFFPCPPSMCISDVNVSAILNIIRQGSSGIFTNLIVNRRCQTFPRGHLPPITVCVGLRNPFSLYREIDESRPAILLITGYTGKIYTINNSTCRIEEWRGDDTCRRAITNTDISGGHYVTVVGYTKDRKYLAIRPGYDHTTIPCAPKDGLVLIEVGNLTEYRVITFRR